MKTKKPKQGKNMEQLDYELKKKKKFPPDEKYPVTEHAKQDTKRKKPVKKIKKK